MIQKYFFIKTEEGNDVEEIEFMLQFDDSGECTDDGESFNPTSGWTNYTGWSYGWSEQDEKLNNLLDNIRDYSQTMELEQLIAEMEITDLNKEYHVKYEENEFTVICTSIEEVEFDKI